MFHLRDGDITVIFNLTVDGRQVAVGVASGGDTEKVVRENLKFFESHSCEYIVCASKSRGKTIELVTEFAKKHDLHLCEIKTNLKSKKAAHLDNVRVAAEIEKCIT